MLIVYQHINTAVISGVSYGGNTEFYAKYLRVGQFHYYLN